MEEIKIIRKRRKIKMAKSKTKSQTINKDVLQNLVGQILAINFRFNHERFLLTKEKDEELIQSYKKLAEDRLTEFLNSESKSSKDVCILTLDESLKGFLVNLSYCQNSRNKEIKVSIGTSLVSVINDEYIEKCHYLARVRVSLLALLREVFQTTKQAWAD